MGQIDSKTNEYMSDSARFADVFNFYLYDGEPVIRPEALREMDRSVVALPYGADARSSETIQRYRDVIRLLTAKEDDQAAYLLLGIEDQAFVHYAMPVRNMLYDAAQYGKQVESAARAHRAEMSAKKIRSDEFLSGFYKEDRLLPVITLVIYWSPEAWDGPKSLHQMLSIKERRLLQFIPDYQINLISPEQIDDKDFERFRTTVGETFQFIKYSKDDKKLRELVNRNKEFQHLDRRSVEVINAITGSSFTVPEGREEVNMCVAIQEIERKATEKAVDHTLIHSIRSLMETMKWTAQQAMDALKISTEDQKRYLAML